MSILTEDQFALGVQLGGSESGSATWGSSTTVTCDIEDFANLAEAVTVDVTKRCSALTLTKRIRESQNVELTVNGLSTGWVFGTDTDQWVKLTITDASLTSEVLTCVIRSNRRTRAPRGGKATQTVRLEVQGIA